MMFNDLGIKPFEQTLEEAVRFKREQDAALDKLLESGRTSRDAERERKKGLKKLGLEKTGKTTLDTEDMLPREEFIQFVCGTFDELKELFLKKNTQYGGGSSYEPLQNFELGAAMHKGASLNHGDRYKRMYEEAKAYERKHVAHVMGNDINAAKVEESLKDIAVYSVIELFMIHKHKQMKAVDCDVRGDNND